MVSGGVRVFRELKLVSGGVRVFRELKLVSGGTELRSCVKVEVTVQGSRPP